MFFLFFFQILLYLIIISSSSLKNDMFFLLPSIYLINPLIWGRIMHNGQQVHHLCSQYNTYHLFQIKPSSNLSEKTILFASTRFRSTGFLQLWNSFLSILISLNFTLIFIRSKIKSIWSGFFVWSVTIHFDTVSIVDISSLDIF